MSRAAGKVRQASDFVLYDVLYEDNTRTSNRKVPSLELSDGDDDLLAKIYIEAQDRKIAELSGRPRTAIKSLTRSVRRVADEPNNLPTRRAGRR